MLAEFDRGRAAGFKYFTLIAGDVGAYGQDLGSSIAELLREMFRREGDFHLNLKDFDPRWLVQYRRELVPLFAANAARIAHMSIPLQSGSETVLDRMKRGHTAADFRDTLLELQRACPTLPRADTHVLLGFPGESEGEFAETVAFLRAVPFRKFDIYLYNDRPKTPASTMPDKVPYPTILARARRLRREFPQQAMICY